MQESSGVRDESPHSSVRRGCTGEPTPPSALQNFTMRPALLHSLDLGTEVVSTSQTHVTLPARDSRLDRYPVSYFKVLHFGANFDNLTTGLVPQDDVMSNAAVANPSALPEVYLSVPPLSDDLSRNRGGKKDVRAADTCRFLHFTQHLSYANRRLYSQHARYTPWADKMEIPPQSGKSCGPSSPTKRDLGARGHWYQ